MAVLDQILLRYFLLSLTGGLWLVLFRLGCRVLPRCFSGRLRRSVWLLILLLPVFSIPWLRPVILPVDTPDWVSCWRLPDPAADYLSEQKIAAANQIYQVGETTNGLYYGNIDKGITVYAQEPDNQSLIIDYAANTEAIPDQNVGSSSKAAVSLPTEILRAVIPGYTILNHLSLIHWIFISGFILNILIRLLWRYRLQKKQGSRRPPQIIDDPSWLRDLAQARDRSGLYQRGTLVGIQNQPRTFLPFWQLWRRHAVAIEEKHLTLDDPEHRQTCLFLALDANRHPDILLYGLYFINRYLAWFSPVSWLSVHFLLDDQNMWRQQRLSRSTRSGHTPRTAVKKTGNRAGRILTTVLTVLLAGFVLAGAVWQNPAFVLPDIRQAVEYQKQLMKSYDLQINEPESTIEKIQYQWLSLYGPLTGSGSVQYFSEINDMGYNDAGIMMIDDQGGVRWKLSVTHIIPPADKTGSYDAPDSSDDPTVDLNIPSPSVKQIDFQPGCFNVQPDGRIDLAGSIYCEDNPAVRKFTAQISPVGELLFWTTVEQYNIDNYDYSGQEKEYFLADGSMLILHSETMSNYNQYSPLASSYSAALPESKTLFSLERRSSDGMTSGLFPSDSPLMRQLNLGTWQTGIISCSRTPKTVFPAPDGGYYLIIQENADMTNTRNPVIGILSRSDAVWPLSLSSTYLYEQSFGHFESSDQIARISADNRLIWLQRLGGGDRLVHVNKGCAATGNRVVLAATISYRQAGVHLSSYYSMFDRSISPAGGNSNNSQSVWSDWDFSGPLYPISEAYQYASLIALDDGGQMLWHQDVYDEFDTQGTDLLLQNNCLTFLVTNNPYVPYIDKIYSMSQSSNKSADVKVPDNMSCQSIWQFNLDGLLLNCGRLPKAGTNLDHFWIFTEPGSVSLPGLVISAD